MLTERYFKSMKSVLEKIEATQIEAIDKSAKAITHCLENGGIWHLMDTGHMLMYEAVGRTGGMMAVRPVRVAVEVSNPTRYRETDVMKPKVFMDEIAGLPEYIIKKSNIQSGDVLMIGSVSGINILPVEMAIYAHQMGVTVIGLTSVEYSKFLQSQHKSGKKLYEVCDVVIDNCCSVGDTLVYVEELDQGICPASGIAASYIMWALQARAVELLLADGKKPHVYISNHMHGADQRNNRAWEEYEKLGY